MGPDTSHVTFKLGKAFTSMRAQSQHHERSASNQESQPLFDVTRMVQKALPSFRMRLWLEGALMESCGHSTIP